MSFQLILLKTKHYFFSILAYIDPADDPIGIVVASCVVIAVLLICVVSTLYISKH